MKTEINNHFSMMMMTRMMRERERMKEREGRDRKEKKEKEKKELRRQEQVGREIGVVHRSLRTVRGEERDEERER